MTATTRNRIGMLLLTILVVLLLIGFTPISKRLLHRVDGSFVPTPYSSLALSTPSVIASGIEAGSDIPIRLSNHTGRTTTYSWTAAQHDVVISRGTQKLANGKSTTLYVTSLGADKGKLTIALMNTKIFLTVPISGSHS
jgi:hypothetical protein